MNRPHFRRHPRPVDPEPYTRLDRLDGLPTRYDAVLDSGPADPEPTRYDAEWPSVLAAEAPGGDLAAMAAPLPGMARDDLGTYAEPVEPRGRHRQTDPADLILADLRDLDGLS